MDALTLTTEEVAEQLHTNRNKIAELRNAGLLKGLRLGKGWIYPTENVIEFLKKNEGKNLTNKERIKNANKENCTATNAR